MSGWQQAEFTRAAGTRMHAAVLGPADAPDVVCVHGLGCSHRYFLPLARRLAPRARVAAPDLPGFGRTPGPPEPLDVRGLSVALADWLRATRRANALLVANSGGCQIVADLAVHAPELLGPVVLNGPTVDRHARSPLHQIGRQLANSRLERATLGVVIARDYLDCGPRRWLATFRYLIEDPIERKLPHLRTPAIVARGSRDPIVPRAWAQEVTRLLPDGRLAEVPGAGHTLNYSAPHELARIVGSLLPEHSAGVPR
ncbi:alpha/beta hydrolase [Micromonospora purpureochromogenes]|uniref:alpha/beta fold hydrolase n=1 Tax=Micromonospora purpureochromogenes TaxID=47872 RepID=UPI003323C5AB